MKNILLIAAVFCAVSVFGSNSEIYRDSSGKIIARATKNGNQTVYRDGAGKIIGQQTQNGTSTVYRNNKGLIKAVKN